MKVEVDVPGSQTLIVLMVSVDVEQHLKKKKKTAKTRNCVKVEVDVLGFPTIIVLMVSVDVKQHSNQPSNSQSSGAV